MGFGQEWKERFEEKLDAYGGKLGEIDEGVAAVRTSLAEADEDRSASPSPQVSDQELYKLRETVSTGTMVLREENRELRRRQERMLSDLKDLRLEITGGRTGMHPTSSPALPEADDSDKAGEVVEARGETGEAAGFPPSSPLSEAPETQDSRRQEECVEREPDGGRRETGNGVPATSAGATSSGETEETPEERMRTVKKAAERALRNRSEDARGRTDRTAVPPAADGRRLHGVHAGGGGGNGPRPGPEDGRETPPDPLAEHAELLLNAAGVSRAELVCHRDTWGFLLVQTVQHPRFRVPGTVEDVNSGNVRTHLSGPSLIAALISLWKAREKSSEEVDADWAMAVVLYDRIRDRLTEAGPGGGRRTVRIVLDDGDGPEETAAAAEPSAGEEPEAA